MTQTNDTRNSMPHIWVGDIGRSGPWSSARIVVWHGAMTRRAHRCAGVSARSGVLYRIIGGAISRDGTSRRRRSSGRDLLLNLLLFRLFFLLVLRLSFLVLRRRASPIANMTIVQSAPPARPPSHENLSGSGLPRGRGRACSLLAGVPSMTVAPPPAATATSPPTTEQRPRARIGDSP